MLENKVKRELFYNFQFIYLNLVYLLNYTYFIIRVTHICNSIWVAGMANIDIIIHY